MYKLDKILFSDPFQSKRNKNDIIEIDIIYKKDTHNKER